MLPKELNNIIQKNLKKIFNDTPADDILVDLLADSVISESEASKIKRIFDDKDKNFELVKILKRRGQSDFFKFCTALQSHEAENVQELGMFLENEANKALKINVPASISRSTQQAASINNPTSASEDSSHKQEVSANNPDGIDTIDAKETLILYDAFLSHSWWNKEHVTTVKEFLENRGFKCWIDDRQLHGGMELLPELAKAIRESKVFVAFMSTTYKESENCYKEISYASDKGKKIIGVIIEDINPRKDLVSSNGRDFLMYIGNSLYIKIIVKDPQDDAMKKKLEELATAIIKYR